MKPTTMAEIENRKKNEEPSRPNCSGSSFSSVMIGTPARPTTILSAKFTSMNRNSRNVIVQAPFGVAVGSLSSCRRIGRSLSAHRFSPSVVYLWHFFDLAVLGANNGFEANATRHFRSKCATQHSVNSVRRHSSC